MDIKEENILGSKISEHWYYRSKLAALLNYTKYLNPKIILDVGAGSGFFSKGLLKETAATEIQCLDTGYSEEKKEFINGKPIQFTNRFIETDADLVLFMDVLEHVDDDVSLLTSYVDKVQSGTYFLITVPAFSFLWSEHDIFLDHKRRYTLNELTSTVSKSGLSVESSSYFYGLIFPLAAITRLFSRFFTKQSKQPRSQLKQHHKITNTILAAVCKADLLLLKKNKFAGLTVFCLARKQENKKTRKQENYEIISD